MPIIAAVDIGTNSVKMTVANADAGKPLEILDDRMEITRLGRGVDQTKSISSEAADTTLQALDGFAKLAKSHNAMIVACGTSAMRDASNGEEFRVRASKTLGAGVEIIAGEREAHLAFLGAMSDAQISDGNESLILVFDVGGGSTELIVGNASGIVRSTSLNVGAVRVTERSLPSDPPTKAEVKGAVKQIDGKLNEFDLDGVAGIIGIGGTATTLHSILAADPDDPLHTQNITLVKLGALEHKLREMTVAKRKSVPGLEPKRADIIYAGLLIVTGIVWEANALGFTSSTRGVRHGLIIDTVGRM